MGDGKHGADQFQCLISGEPATLRVIEHRPLYPERLDISKMPAWNLMPLSDAGFDEALSLGLRRFAASYPAVRAWLVSHGWTVDPVLLRWTHPEVQRALRRKS